MHSDGGREVKWGLLDCLDQQHQRYGNTRRAGNSDREATLPPNAGAVPGSPFPLLSSQFISRCQDSLANKHLRHNDRKSGST